MNKEESVIDAEGETAWRCGGREGRWAADKRCHEEGEDVTKTAQDDT